MVEEKTKEVRKSLEDTKEKVNKYVFDEGVNVVLIPPDRVLVEFSVLGLAYNDLYRFFTGYGSNIKLTHEQPFEDKAIKYARAVIPNIKIKKAEEVRVDHNHNVQVVLRVQKFPNHIGEGWMTDRSLPYAGYKSLQVDVVDYGKGRDGRGFIYRSQENLDRKSDYKPYDPYKDMKSAKPGNKKTASLDDDSCIGLTSEENQILADSIDRVKKYASETSLTSLDEARQKQSIADFLEREKLWGSYPGVENIVDFIFDQIQEKTSQPKLYKLKEGKIGLSEKLLNEYFDIAE